MPVDPTADDIKRFAAEDDGQPVTMLNLLRFKPTGGQASYERYAVEIMPFLERVGAEVVYAGKTSTALVASGERWDAVLLVRYPTRQAFLDMVFNPAYQQITQHRTAALEQAVLQATTAWSPAA